MSDKYIKVFKVRNEDLPRATTLMNYSSINESFRSRVINIIAGNSESMVMVEMIDSYPYITNEWEEVIVQC